MFSSCRSVHRSFANALLYLVDDLKRGCDAHQYASLLCRRNDRLGSTCMVALQSTAFEFTVVTVKAFVYNLSTYNVARTMLATVTFLCLYMLARHTLAVHRKGDV